MKKLASLFGVFGIAAVVPMAHAAIQISYLINGVPPTTVCAVNVVSSGPVSCSISTGGTTIQVSASSNSPGAPTLAEEFGSVSVTTTDAVNISLWISASSFTAPIAPPDITSVSSLSTTSTTGTGSVNLATCLDGTKLICGFLTNITETYNGASFTSHSANKTISSLSGPYTLTQLINLTLGANSNLSVITSQVLTPIPEPASVALLVGVVLFAAGGIRRQVHRA